MWVLNYAFILKRVYCVFSTTDKSERKKSRSKKNGFPLIIEE